MLQRAVTQFNKPPLVRNMNLIIPNNAEMFYITYHYILLVRNMNLIIVPNNTKIFIVQLLKQNIEAGFHKHGPLEFHKIIYFHLEKEM